MDEILRMNLGSLVGDMFGSIISVPSMLVILVINYIVLNSI